ncbi:GGDEF domain-containing protein [Kineococcus sp. LSe6-4]|uniref:GGDEF domain-containing protein n=1 Tax=Kineococcus halophytocola TaxID=3234027 RepID=A0ABV4H4S0_9ACTN
MRPDPEDGTTRRPRGGDLPWAPAWLRAGTRRVPARWRAGGPAVVAGRALLLVTGALLALTVWVLAPDAGDTLVLAGVSAAALALLAGSAVLPWHRWPVRAALVFPLTVMGALAVLGTSTEHLAGAYVPFFVLCFVYVGVFLPPRTAFGLLPVAVPLYLLASDDLDLTVVVRTAVVVCTWLIVAELLAQLARRQRAAADVLVRDARTDPLTTIGNRRDLEDRMTRLAPGDTVVVCDLDHFKQVNDTHGHAFGDQVLREFGAMLAAGLRRDDYAARFGGEEFVLLLHASGTGPAMDVVDRLRQTWRDGGGATTFSAGCATLDEVTTAEQALVAADAALYAAKRAGRDRTRSAEAADGWGPRVGADTVRDLSHEF